MVTQLPCQPCFLGWAWGNTRCLGNPPGPSTKRKRSKTIQPQARDCSSLSLNSQRWGSDPLPKAAPAQGAVAPQVCHLSLCLYFSNPWPGTRSHYVSPQKALPSGLPQPVCPCGSSLNPRGLGCLSLVLFCSHWDKLFILQNAPMLIL